MKRKSLITGLACAAGILALAIILFLAEREAPGATITGLGSALWYMLTTMTTVGYGDTYPVTGLGRVVGALFQLMSLGLLAFILSAAVSALRQELIPRLRLRLGRDRDWLVFTRGSEAALSLAKALRQSEPEAMVIFCGEDNPPEGCLASPFPPEELFKMKGRKGAFSLFAMGESFAENEAFAAALADTGARVYCLSGHMPDSLPKNETRSDPYGLTARLYWKRFPMEKADEKIVLIGGGPYAEAILAEGLARNVMDDPQSAVYRVFGDFSGFKAERPGLYPLFADSEGKGRDALIFSGGDWIESREALMTAARIIFALDSEDETLRQLTRLFRSLYGMPLHKYVQTQRLERAASLLADGGSNISEAASRSGWSNMSHFSKEFQKKFGMSPKKFAMGR
mgnify:CR=1 FL=1